MKYTGYVYRRLLTSLTIVAAASLLVNVGAAGSLEPEAGPYPSMRTLEEIYEKIQVLAPDRMMSATTTAVAKGYYEANDLGAIDPDLASTNIASGVTIFGVTGSFIGSDVPIGAIVAMHKDMPGTPSLDELWAECNGQVVNDPRSPLHGVTLPNLNGKYRYYHRKGVFLRGSDISGIFEDDAFQGHRHAIRSLEASSLWYSQFGYMMSPYAYYPDYNTTNAVSIRHPITDGINGSPRTDSETRPKNMSVVWIIKIR